MAATKAESGKKTRRERKHVPHGMVSIQASFNNTKITISDAGDTVRMKWKGAGQTEGQVTANGFTMTNEGMTLAYRK